MIRLEFISGSWPEGPPTVMTRAVILLAITLRESFVGRQAYDQVV
jgi:hypothetical protein